MRRHPRRVLLCVVVAAAAALGVWLHMRPEIPAPLPGWEAVDHVVDGDTIVLRGGVTVRLVQIDTPEVYFHPECFGEPASAETKHLLHRGTLVRLVMDPATDRRTCMAGCFATSCGATD